MLAMVGIACIAVLIVVVLVLRTARDSKLGRFKFSISASLLKGTFGIEVESQREPDKLPPAEAAAERAGLLERHLAECQRLRRELLGGS